MQVFLLCLESNNRQTFKWSRKTFSLVCMLFIQLASINVFNPCDNWKTSFLIKVYCYPDIFFTRHVLAFLEKAFWKKSVFYLLQRFFNSASVFLNFLHELSIKRCLGVAQFQSGIAYKKMCIYLCNKSTINTKNQKNLSHKCIQ